MGNIRGWGGPLPPSWYKIPLDLQRKILTAMRNLGMAPVLPGFAGFVPDGLKRVYPQAKLSRVSRWGGFNSTYCCTYHLHSTDPLFKVLVRFSAIRALPVKKHNYTVSQSRPSLDRRLFSSVSRHPTNPNSASFIRERGTEKRETKDRGGKGCMGWRRQTPYPGLQHIFV